MQVNTGGEYRCLQGFLRTNRLNEEYYLYAHSTKKCVQRFSNDLRWRALYLHCDGLHKKSVPVLQDSKRDSTSMSTLGLCPRSYAASRKMIFREV